MKKVHILVLKAFFRPFIVTFFIVMFILLMLFLFKYIDDLIGKGFEWYVILELLYYASAANVAMALPLAVLLSSIMTFGSLGENYELVAIKSAGISLTRAMMPLVIVICGLAISAFLFSNYILPRANLKFGSLLYDVRNQKSARLINEGVFNNSFPGYAIRVKTKDPDGQTLHEVMIYEHNDNGSNNVLLAKQGRMYKSDDNQWLILKLNDGVRYNEEAGEGAYDPRQRFMRFKFKETVQKFDLSGLTLTRTDENLFKSNYQMLNLKQLNYYTDSMRYKVDSNINLTFKIIKPYYKQYTTVAGFQKIKPIKFPNYKSILEILPEDKRLSSIQGAKDQVHSIKQVLISQEISNQDYSNRMKGYMLEFHRKFTLAVSCLVLFFIGAPLGAIIRKGGLGLPVVMSVLFFLVYHIISTVGEKYVKDGSLEPIIGMWVAIVILSPLGAFLTYKAAVDSVLFDIDIYKQWFKKLLPKKMRSGNKIAL
ncbi:MAG: permease YjgP/YjgQ family protein [Sphingobacteriales bacterium]|nr:permease YjgP/YjgQ family protein [Sphingobacteriales bacterium]